MIVIVTLFFATGHTTCNNTILIAERWLAIWNLIIEWHFGVALFRENRESLRAHSPQVSPGDLVQLGVECQEISHLHLVWFALMLHFTQADQIAWTVPHSYKNCSFEVVLPKTTTDPEKKSTRKKTTWLIDWPGLKSAGLFTTKKKQNKTVEQHQIYAVLGFLFYCGVQT